MPKKEVDCLCWLCVTPSHETNRSMKDVYVLWIHACLRQFLLSRINMASNSRSEALPDPR